MPDAATVTSSAGDVAATVSATRSDAVEPPTAPEEPCSRAAVARTHCSLVHFILRSTIRFC